MDVGGVDSNMYRFNGWTLLAYDPRHNIWNFEFLHNFSPVLLLFLRRFLVLMNFNFLIFICQVCIVDLINLHGYSFHIPFPSPRRCTILTAFLPDARISIYQADRWEWWFTLWKPLISFPDTKLVSCKLPPCIFTLWLKQRILPHGIVRLSVRIVISAQLTVTQKLHTQLNNIDDECASK